MKNPKFMQGHCLIQLCKRTCLSFWPMVANIATLPCLISVSRRLQCPNVGKVKVFENIKHIIQLLLPARHGISINPASWRPQDPCPWKDQGGPRSRQVPGHPQGLRSLSMLLLRAENRHQQSSSTLQDTHQISSAFSVAFQIYAKVI